MTSINGGLQYQNHPDEGFLIWSGVFLLLLHIGYACMEAGRVRLKYASNVFFKLFIHLFISNFVYWIFGYGIAFNEGNYFIGLNWWTNFNDRPVPADLFYNWAISALPVTILSGTAGERVNPFAFTVNSILITGVIQPITVHWIWTSEGWLYKLGFVDVAGASVTFIFAAAACFTASFIIPFRRTDSFLIHSSQAFGVGSMITITGFLILNCGAFYRDSGGTVNMESLSRIVQNTILSGSGGCIVSLIVSKIVDTTRGKRMQVISVSVNGTFAAMVTISGATNYYYPLEALAVGVVGAIIFLQFHYLFLYLKGYYCMREKVNDPSDAFPIYFGGGIWSIIAVGIFTENGILFNRDTFGCLKGLVVNLVGALAIFLWSTIWTMVIFLILKMMKAIKTDNECELKGIQFNGNQIRSEEDYIEALPYIIQEKSVSREGLNSTVQNFRVNRAHSNIDLYENLNSRRERRL